MLYVLLLLHDLYSLLCMRALLHFPVLLSISAGQQLGPDWLVSELWRRHTCHLWERDRLDPIRWWMLGGVARALPCAVCPLLLQRETGQGVRICSTSKWQLKKRIYSKEVVVKACKADKVCQRGAMVKAILRAHSVRRDHTAQNEE